MSGHEAKCLETPQVPDTRNINTPPLKKGFTKEEFTANACWPMPPPLWTSSSSLRGPERQNLRPARCVLCPIWPCSVACHTTTPPIVLPGSVLPQCPVWPRSPRPLHEPTLVAGADIATAPKIHGGWDPRTSGSSVTLCATPGSPLAHGGASVWETPLPTWRPSLQ